MLNLETEKYKSLFKSLGQESLHYLYPQDFEAYVISLEIVDPDLDITLESLTFPILPDSIKETESNIIQIQQNNGGISIFNTEVFIPKNIQLSGNFGRRFRFLIGRNLVDAMAFSTIGSFKDAVKNLAKVVFYSNQIKTGYGVTKILEGMLKKTRMTNSKGNFYKLYFYNLALGHYYQVKLMNFTFSQSIQNNMIWDYDIQLIAISPLSGLTMLKQKLLGVMTNDIIGKGINKLTRDLDDKVFSAAEKMGEKVENRITSNIEGYLKKN